MPDIEAILVQTMEASGPFGAKAIAEIPKDGVAPAMRNAIANATGVSSTHPVHPGAGVAGAAGRVRATGEAPILDALTEAVSGGEPVVLATIVDTEGSVPRHAGTKMVVGADGSSIRDHRWAEPSRQPFVQMPSTCSRHDVPRRRSTSSQTPMRAIVGVCGGTMTVYLEPYMAPHTVYVIGAATSVAPSSTSPTGSAIGPSWSTTAASS